MALLVLAAALGAPLAAARAQNLASGPIEACRSAHPGDTGRYHLCLINEFAALDRKLDLLTDQLLGRIGEQRTLGRLRIMQWSSAVSGSQSGWKKFVAADCEWNGHLHTGESAAAALMTECRIERGLARAQLLEQRISDADALFAAMAQKAATGDK